MPEHATREDVWTAPVAPGPVDATIRVPGSKSITNRAYVLAALSAGQTLVRQPLDSRDTRLMLGALAELGAEHERTPEGVLVHPLTPGDGASVQVELGNAGTVARFTPALATLGTRTVRFDGDPAIRRRPVSPLLSALSALGAVIEDEGRGAPPFTVQGGGRLGGGTVELDSTASSQFLSALLLAAPAFDGGATVRLVGGAPPSEPHIAMTMDMLRRFGADPSREGSEFHVPHADLRRTDFTVEPDLSTAAPFVLAPLVTGGTVRIAGWPEHTTQPGDWLRSLVRELGGRAELDDHGLTVTGDGRLRGTRLDLHEVGELTPVIAALLCFADGPSVIAGVAHLRGHETDRLAALATELSALGAEVTDTADGLRITPAPLHGGVFHTYDDHRLVMAGAVLGLRVTGLQVENPATVGKTFPGFVDAWQELLG
ncbi:3-phosphoshikimate 1-carboxyvinyltransferase [Amycolatopsis cihanbeyliensis]|uniref:3-phosphoshikimate 1-carboxyvinyltransferase n=1 Tax=Amycolatopsis cihanbeyliensis TaxID=1128664 RepID=A0A542DEF3_AMYCI|nr:3-phosphoshikimate 1-carboxyvinyltransferase [Amycolatopsis cihanbeyliensis]TQJ01457.1 3-phosphoshikimate 1-carboxyvinyltransferase [Amycolatopsis cihanbeyliensis]